MATLVVADDESLVTDFLTFLLECEGHAVHVASNGRQALKVIDEVRPALIITDLMMPVMPGLQLAQTLRESAKFSHLPIILCSSVADPVAQHELHLFTAILRKPYPPARLINLVNENIDATG
ncbi:response regulator [Paraburkholderia sp. RL17-373-BIF-A]|uniref:response regulator n=1 Tax=Paraburkholderia sp. RL17-373-BIF-A TaxID=3031629 RepID=UPI0038BA98CA